MTSSCIVGGIFETKYGLPGHVNEGRMNRSLLDTGGEALVVSQFTLAAEIRASDRKVGIGFRANPMLN